MISSLTYRVEKSDDVRPVHIYHSNSYLKNEIEDMRAVGANGVAALREFQLVLRWIHLEDRGVAGSTKARFTADGVEEVESLLESEYRLSVDVPEWAILSEDDPEDVFFVDSYDGYREAVDLALDQTPSIDRDPVERWRSAYEDFANDSNLSNFVPLYSVRLSDEIAVGEIDGARVLVFFLGIAKIELWNEELRFGDVYLSQKCAADIECIYEMWNLDVSVPDSVVYGGRGPRPDRVIMDTGEFFEIVYDLCEEAEDVVRLDLTGLRASC
jgi:hypothetical protein